MVTRAGTPMRIVFFGTPEFAVPSLESLLRSSHPVVGVVTRPDRPAGRGRLIQEPAVKRVASALGLPILQPERLADEGFLASLAALDADLGVVAAYGKILSESLLRSLRLGFINVHASLLPKYRGAAPVNRAVMAGEATTGVTIMRVVPALDAGPIMASQPRPIGPDETADEVERDLSSMGAGLLLAVVEGLATGRAAEVPQDDALATCAPRLEKSDAPIDWRLPARVIHDRVRGLHPWPHAHAHLGGARYIVLRTRVEPAGTPPDGAGAPIPGQIVRAAGDALAVATGNGILDIVQIQPEGRRPLTAREFLAGHRLAAGSIFTRPDDPR